MRMGKSGPSWGFACITILAPPRPASYFACVYESPIIAKAKVLRVIKPGLFEVALPNGKISLGHLSRELAKSPPELGPGAEVTLELTPFDFDSARISQVNATGE